MNSKLGRKPTDLDYGLGEHSIDGDRIGLVDEQELTERLIRTFAQPSYRPPRLPAIAMQLLALSRRPDVEFKEIESLFEQDPILTGEVLAIARSAYYSGVRPVNSLGAALVRIGLSGLREIVMRAALDLRVFRSAAYAGCMDRLRTHSLATANLCRLLSKYTPVTQDRAFLCGLLHDVGIAGILLVLGDAEAGNKLPDLAVLWPAVDGAHAPAGARMVELWRLQPEFCEVVAAHHQVRVDGVDHLMAANVCLAEAVAGELDLGFIPGDEGAGVHPELESSGLLLHGRIDRSPSAVIERAKAVLELTDSNLDRFREDALEWAESSKSQECEPA